MCLEIWIMRIAVSNVVSEYSSGGVGCLEIWIMRIAVSNVVSEYSSGGVNFTHRVRDMMFESGTGYEVRDMRYVVHSVRYG